MSNNTNTKPAAIVDTANGIISFSQNLSNPNNKIRFTRIVAAVQSAAKLPEDQRGALRTVVANTVKDLEKNAGITVTNDAIKQLFMMCQGKVNNQQPVQQPKPSNTTNTTSTTRQRGKDSNGNLHTNACIMVHLLIKVGTAMAHPELENILFTQKEMGQWRDAYKRMVIESGRETKPGLKKLIAEADNCTCPNCSAKKFDKTVLREMALVASRTIRMK